MPVSDQAVQELHDKCKASLAVCRAALEKKRGKVDAALAALIDDGRVSVTDLNPETVSEALFARAELRRLKERNRTFAREHPEDKLGLEMLELQLMGAKCDLGVLGEIVRGAALERKRGTRRKAEERKPQTVKLPPLPPLKFEVDEWTGRDTLPAWAGFADVGDGFGPRRKSKGKVGVVVAAADEDEEAPPTPEQVAAYAYLKGHTAAITRAVVAAVFKKYPTWRKNYGADEMDDDPDFHMPPIKTPEELKRLIGLVTVRIRPVARGGTAYVGLDFACTWDDEHGLGVMTHKSRVIDLGDSDVSFMDFAAKKDGGKKLAPKRKKARAS